MNIDSSLKAQAIEEAKKTLAKTELDTQKDLALLLEDSSNETKSSAGDKYETGRAMIDLEKDKLYARLAQNTKLKRAFAEIQVSKISDTVEHGSLFSTNQGVYFISASLGQINVNGLDIFCISALSPIGKAAMGKKENEEFSFLNKKQTIKTVC
ncbi:3-oxoacyl-ACP synthase [Aureibacter tunicatorum]|uniref:3-oxoacyl-ACP synthase n=1 Tax=Aureibacter tunicatorum TaxID=866807 RepID=A0AAE3XKF7_9BACT|nr:3-oxoacyl-ACP synthase [Aureibacter tunicatorum]MDR6238160.1 hypothetical protein [Aureibacter tunicatorum]BDD03193.1 hypothetical protein AUTU_06760 [Aureibacter tunicatorum]